REKLKPPKRLQFSSGFPPGVFWNPSFQNLPGGLQHARIRARSFVSNVRPGVWVQCGNDV
ncbi:MAG: hypothetical protein NZ534_08065, partial [Bacteroidia bacterium]|nr:hypothetical protein [Bacteroidia bacterium]